MTLASALFAVGAALVAALCVFADGALLGLDEEEPPSDPRVRALLSRREHAHRALAFGRILAQLLAGTATSVALLSSRWVPAPYVAPVIVLAGIALVILSESAARAAGAARRAATITSQSRLLMRTSGITTAALSSSPFRARRGGRAARGSATRSPSSVNPTRARPP